MGDDSLASFVNAVSGQDMLAVEERFEGGYVRLRTAEAQRRQAKHDIRCVEDIVIELLRNARDAAARRIYVATTRADATRTLVVLDDGDGIPPNMHELVFEPRVTGKLETMVVDSWGVHGRGMALYSIACNVEHAGVFSSDAGLGTSLGVTADTAQLPEKADQSTAPLLAKDEDGKLQVARGPHNIVRTAVEFALEEKEHVTVYLGSPAEIVATLRAHGAKQLDDEQLLFCDDIGTLPVCLRPAAAADAAELVAISEQLGLCISERTAHRVLAGQIHPVSSLLKSLDRTRASHTQHHEQALYKDSRGLKIAPEDLERFSHALQDSFEPLAERYFLELNAAPKIRVGKDGITVTFSIDKKL